MGKITGWRKVDGKLNLHRERIIYISILTNKTITLQRTRTNKYHLFVRNVFESEELFKSFNTKEDAIKFAIKYARGHPNG